jgi:hypothetical protein
VRESVTHVSGTKWNLCLGSLIHIRGTVDDFAIVFQPSALGLLFALPAQEFTDQDVDAEQVFGAIIARFHERLADCRTFEERISVAN